VLHEFLAALTADADAVADAEVKTFWLQSRFSRKKKNFWSEILWPLLVRLPDSRNLSNNLPGPPHTKEGTLIMEKEFKPDIY